MGVTLRSIVVRGVVALSLAAAGSAAFAAEPLQRALTKDNFVDVGDSLVDLLDTSGLAFATFVLGQADTGLARHAVFGPLPGKARAEPFQAACPGGGSVDGRIVDTDADGAL